MAQTVQTRAGDLQSCMVSQVPTLPSPCQLLASSGCSGLFRRGPQTKGSSVSPRLGVGSGPGAQPFPQAHQGGGRRKPLLRGLGPGPVGGKFRCVCDLVQGSPVSRSGGFHLKTQAETAYGSVTGELLWFWGPSYSGGQFWMSVGVCKSRWVCMIRSSCLLCQLCMYVCVCVGAPVGLFGYGCQCNCECMSGYLWITAGRYESQCMWVSGIGQCH